MIGRDRKLVENGGLHKVIILARKLDNPGLFEPLWDVVTASFGNTLSGNRSPICYLYIHFFSLLWISRPFSNLIGGCNRPKDSLTSPIVCPLLPTLQHPFIVKTVRNNVHLAETGTNHSIRGHSPGTRSTQFEWLQQHDFRKGYFDASQDQSSEQVFGHQHTVFANA